MNIIGLTINAALGLALALFFLFFVGIAPVFANSYEGTNLGYMDTTRDFVLVVIRSTGMATVHFEDEASCRKAAEQVELLIPSASTFCTGESE